MRKKTVGQRLVLLLLPVLCCFNLLAQLSESDTARWTLTVNLSGRLNKGNVERFIITPEVNLTHVDSARSYGFASGNRYTYGTFGAFKSENDWLSRNFFYLKPQAKFYPFAMLWVQTHERQKLRFRYQAGAGITWAAVRKPGDVLKLSLTGTYESNRYRASGLTIIKDPQAKNYNVVRGTLRVAGNHLLAQRVVNLYYECYFQQALNNARNWRVFAEGGVNVRVIGGFGMRVFSTYEYQQVHIATEKPYDLIFNFGLSYRRA